jgi:hypothetical protein
MANTVTLLSYANTFGDWVVTTNALAKENNDIAANNYVKPTGTLYLNDPTLGLQVANNAIIAGQLQVTGVGSSAYVQNNLRVDGQTYLQNTTLSLVALGQANIGGPLLALSSGTGLAVSNNTTIGGFLRVSGNSSITGAVAMGNTLSVVSATALGNTLSVTSAATMGSTLTVADNGSFGNNLSVLNNTSSYNYFAGGLSNTNNLIVRTRANILGATITNDTVTNTLQANTSVTTPLGYINLLQANNSVNTSSASVTNTLYANNIVANSGIVIPKITVTNLLDANAVPGYFSSLYTSGQLSVGGNFIINGATVYNTNTFTLSASSNNQISYFNVYRSPGANASIRWNEPQKYWDMLDVNNSTYYRILTTETISDSVISTSQVTAASSNAANILNNSIVTANTSMKSYVDNSVLTANTNMKYYVDNSVSTANSSMKSYVDANTSSLQSQISSNVSSLQSQISSNVSIISGIDATQNTNITNLNTFAQAAFNKANTGSGTFNGTVGQSIANNGVFTFSSNNGVVISGTANTMYFNTAQDLRTTASPTFNNLTLTNPLAIAQGGTGTTTAAQALTNLLPTGTTSGYVLTTGGPGTFYWSASGGGGGGTTPGTTIASTRITYTANGSGLAYATPVYVPGASQLRIYIDGVRQFASEYTETSGNTAGSGIVTFTSSPPAGSTILVEVDGYIINPYYANNIAYTVNSTISSTANTIQLAIDTLASISALKSGTVFTGLVLAPTAATTTSNTQIATTAYVNNLANSGYVFAHSISGNAATVTNGVYNNGGNYSINISGLAATATTATTANALNTGNNYQINSLGVGTAPSGTAGEIRAINNITAYYSDDRLKTRLGNIENALEKVMSLNGFNYEANETAQALGYQVKPEVGLSAQEVQAVLPEVVVPAPIDEKYLTIHYERVIPLLVEAIKELKAEIDTLKGSK